MAASLEAGSSTRGLGCSGVRAYEQLGVSEQHSAPRKIGFAAIILGVVGLTAMLVHKMAPSATEMQSSGLNALIEQDARAAPEKPHEEKEKKPVQFSPLLFCFAMTRTKGYEPDLLSAQYYNQAGIFGCDSHKVYSTGGVVNVGPITTEEVVAPTSSIGDFSEAGTATDSWLNTATFIKAWDAVVEEGTWWSHDWTVKVDPDAVFFPSRLRVKMEPHTGGLNARPAWVGNCDRVWHGSKPHLKLFGSLEVLSRNALGTYKAFGKKCQEELEWKGWGEDMFMQNCMDMLKVEAINGTDFLGDKRCYDAPCTDFTKVAFHDFKAVDTFFQCWGQSKGSERVYLKEQARIKEEQRLEKLRQEKLEKERLEKLEQERVEQARLEKERLEKEQLERDQLEDEQLAKEQSEKTVSAAVRKVQAIEDDTVFIRK